MQNEVRTNTKHKDRLFRFLFSTKENLLSLYNAMNNSNYKDPEELIIYTMDDYVYMGMKNDLSFLIDSNLNLFEHQSTYNPNMPLRGFLYMASGFQKYIAQNHLDLYSSRQIQLPIPRYYVFYNGKKALPEEVFLRLTDAMPGDNPSEISCTEFKAHMININAGQNTDLMKKCPLLFEYSQFVKAIRKNQDAGLDLSTSIDQAIRNFPPGQLADILQAHRAEVTDMLLSEYDEAFHISNEKDISYEEGRKVERINMILRCLQKGMGNSEIIELFGISPDELQEIITAHPDIEQV